VSTVVGFTLSQSTCIYLST